MVANPIHSLCLEVRDRGAIENRLPIATVGLVREQGLKDLAGTAVSSMVNNVAAVSVRAAAWLRCSSGVTGPEAVTGAGAVLAAWGRSWSAPARLELPDKAPPSRCPPTATPPSWVDLSATSTPGRRGSSTATRRSIRSPMQASCTSPAWRPLCTNPTRDARRDILNQTRWFPLSLLKTPNRRENLEIFASSPYRCGHDHDSFGPPIPALIPTS
jgi:hypothetical protein